MDETLLDEHAEKASGDTFALQNERMLKVALNGEVLARQGAMVAYQGHMDFDYQGGGLGRLLKKAVTGEGLPLIRVSGQGDLFLADQAAEVHLIRLENDSITVNGENVLAFEKSLEWDINRVRGVGLAAGGLFNVVISGTGWLAITAFGTPVTLRVDGPTYADVASAIAWSTSLRTSIHSSFKAGAFIGRASGELFQLAFEGQGQVIVQASEGRPLPVATQK